MIRFLCRCFRSLQVLYTILRHFSRSFFLRNFLVLLVVFLFLFVFFSRQTIIDISTENIHAWLSIIPTSLIFHQRCRVHLFFFYNFCCVFRKIFFDDIDSKYLLDPEEDGAESVEFDWWCFCCSSSSTFFAICRFPLTHFSCSSSTMEGSEWEKKIKETTDRQTYMQTPKNGLRRKKPKSQKKERKTD